MKLFQLHFKKHIFAPSLIPTIAFLIFFLLTLFLAHWQWTRAHYKQTLLDAYRARQTMVSARLQDTEKNPENYQYRPIVVTGIYDTAHTFLLDNSMHNAMPGWMVMTPFRINGTNKIILVNRGWIAANGNRHILPNVEASSGKQIIHGLIKLPPEKIFLLGENENSNTWPRVVEAIELKTMEKNLQHPLEPFLILLAPNEKNGYLRDWQPTLPMGPEKHIAYAVQWLALGCTLVIMYILLNIKRKQ